VDGDSGREDAGVSKRFGGIGSRRDDRREGGGEFYEAEYVFKTMSIVNLAW